KITPAHVCQLNLVTLGFRRRPIVTRRQESPCRVIGAKALPSQVAFYAENLASPVIDEGRVLNGGAGSRREQVAALVYEAASLIVTERSLTLYCRRSVLHHDLSRSSKCI